VGHDESMVHIRFPCRGESGHEFEELGFGLR
jgi:hypothetical protein